MISTYIYWWIWLRIYIIIIIIIIKYHAQSMQFSSNVFLLHKEKEFNYMAAANVSIYTTLYIYKCQAKLITI